MECPPFDTRAKCLRVRKSRVPAVLALLFAGLAAIPNCSVFSPDASSKGHATRGSLHRSTPWAPACLRSRRQHAARLRRAEPETMHMHIAGNLTAAVLLH
jgi:hypothetical protein